jgi:hypothetical protein
MKPAIRLPVQVGTTCLRNATWAAATLVPGLMLLSVAVEMGLGQRDTSSMVVGVVFGLLLFGWGLLCVSWAWQTRPSDVELSQDGLRIDGGPHHGLRLAWSEIDVPRCKLEAHRLSKGDVGWWDLKLATLAGREIMLAESEQRDESRSLHVLLESIRSVTGHQTAHPARPPTSVDVLRCGRCGAPAVPVDSDSTLCRYCGSSISVPAALRQKMAMQHALASKTANVESRLRTLLAQPGAAVAGRRIVLALATSMVAWILVIVWQGVPGLAGTVMTAMFDEGAIGALLVIAIGCVARAGLARRGALQLIATRFGARAPVNPGDPSLCRNCYAPLPMPSEDRLIAPCAYCATENVLGIDLRTQVADERKQEATLDKSLRDLRHKKIRWRLGAVLAALPALAISAWLVEQDLDWARCEANDAQACARLANRLLDESKGLMNKIAQKNAEYDDRVRAKADKLNQERRRALGKACRGGVVEACRALKGK